MQGYNLIIVFNEDKSRILMCRRKKEPYKDLSNFVGGKIEPGEDGLEAAYRELREETGIGREDITLRALMDFVYRLDNCRVEVYAGRLKRTIEVFGDENELYWSLLDRDFFSMEEFAGEGNIGHMLEHVKMHRDELLG